MQIVFSQKCNPTYILIINTKKLEKVHFSVDIIHVLKSFINLFSCVTYKTVAQLWEKWQILTNARFV